MVEQMRATDATTDRQWLLDFLGLLALLGFRAFELGEPIYLFWFGFAGFLSFFGARWPWARYLGLLGVVGVLVAVLGVIGVVPV
jgi:hypothetical protein